MAQIYSKSPLKSRKIFQLTLKAPELRRKSCYIPLFHPRHCNEILYAGTGPRKAFTLRSSQQQNQEHSWGPVRYVRNRQAGATAGSQHAAAWEVPALQPLPAWHSRVYWVAQLRKAGSWCRQGSGATQALRVTKTLHALHLRLAR